MKRTLKAGPCLLVLALLAGRAIERSFAGDAAPGAKRAPLGQVKTKFVAVAGPFSHRGGGRQSRKGGTQAICWPSSTPSDCFQQDQR